MTKLTGVQQVELVDGTKENTYYLAGVQRVEVINPPDEPRPLEWQQLTLENGTQPYGPTSHPHYAVRDGIVYLKGMVNNYPISGTNAPENCIFTLPAEARPPVALFMVTRGIGGTHTDFASIIIFNNGRVNISQSGGLTNVSLGGLSFPNT